MEVGEWTSELQRCQCFFLWGFNSYSSNRPATFSHSPGGQAVTEVDVLLTEPEPKTRAGFLKYSQEITLDPNTADRNLLLSEENRKVTSKNQLQPYPDHPDRFNGWPQGLSRESLTGRCYWEEEWRGGGVDVVVSCKNISRAGRSTDYLDSMTTLAHYIVTQTVTHFGTTVSQLQYQVQFPPESFYSISETMTLLHTV
ncbi:hypothetical protein AMECASPLE_023857 [Ameca splendens]|uniref:SPRY-associated domain-containing protein n=1 Tax=Ameca splendens TaxID=208324 RepID=A0ABV0YSF4_9TELE